jgi:Homeodomain-like domain
MSAPRVTECWCCGRDPRAASSHSRSARGLCYRCYQRWRYRGFTGPGPGPERLPRAEHAREYERVITSLSARRAAEQLGISPRTVVRWRAALREAS